MGDAGIAVEQNSRSRGVLLVAVLIAVFVVPLSVSGTAVALSDIAESLGTSPVGQQWALNGFNVTFAASTLAWGSLADRIGRWRSFQLGACVFVVGSAASVLATGYLVLDVARLVAGIGAGAVFSVGSALLSVVFTGDGRARVFSLLGAMAGLALAFGPTLCGAIAQMWSWRGIFLLQGMLLTVSVALMFAGRGLLRGEPHSALPFDWRGAILFFVATAAVVAALVTGSDAGLLAPGVLAMFALGVVSFLYLLHCERRTSSPLLDLTLIRYPRFLGVTLVVAVASFTFAAIVTYSPSLMQAEYDLSQAASGAFVMFMTVPTLIMPLVGGVLVARSIPARHVLSIASVLMVAGAGLVALGAATTVWLLVPAMVALGTGFGLHAGLVDNEGLATAPAEDAGMAAGWINTVRVGTEAVAVSLFGAVFIPALTSGDPAGAFSGVAAVAAVVALVLTVVSVRAMYRKG